eukprot:CAMPEP_0117648498 /NCGR_PEP_ID=MMETSP0804-20121206/438_1 /TAXON_ID=1074897 /ORGANISM="Tetraselmis astigmatica, Strain CCMP880" /LENGTH=462 /DNA_ID=CAMNT_0005454107 /DNA_START=252 /DNA_END=1639 /DNA_ORIENTATION=+
MILIHSYLATLAPAMGRVRASSLICGPSQLGSYLGHSSAALPNSLTPAPIFQAAVAPTAQRPPLHDGPGASSASPTATGAHQKQRVTTQTAPLEPNSTTTQTVAPTPNDTSTQTAVSSSVSTATETQTLPPEDLASQPSQTEVACQTSTAPAGVSTSVSNATAPTRAAAEQPALIAAPCPIAPLESGDSYKRRNATNDEPGVELPAAPTTDSEAAPTPHAPGPREPSLPAGIHKYISFLLSLDPHARRASFSANKKELLAEFDKLKGCKRCDFVQFVFKLCDHEGDRPMPWILPRSQLTALLSSQSLVNLLQFEWKDTNRVVLSGSLLVEDRLLTSFLAKSLEFVQEVHQDWEECSKHRGYPGPSELQSTARRLQERETECNRELLAILQHNGEGGDAPPPPQPAVLPAPEHAAGASAAAAAVAAATARSPATAAVMDALRSRWGVSSETLEALALLGDRMA